jgi:hypothetical protein
MGERSSLGMMFMLVDTLWQVAVLDFKCRNRPLPGGVQLGKFSTIIASFDYIQQAAEKVFSAVIARSKATKQSRDRASTGVNGVAFGGNVVWIASLRSQRRERSPFSAAC